MKTEIEMETLSCANCDVPIVATEVFFDCRREDHNTFYCLNGHGNVFKGKTEAEKLQERLLQEQKKNSDLQKQLDKAIFPPTPKKRGRPKKII